MTRTAANGREEATNSSSGESICYRVRWLAWCRPGVGERTVQCSVKKDDVIAANTNRPRTCVAINIPKAGRTGLCLWIHFGLLFASFASVFSLAVPVGASSSIQAAVTHSYSPANIMATLTRTALGRKLPILRNVVGLVMM